jgi:hypothetical protein
LGIDLSFNPIQWSVIEETESQIVVGQLAGSIQAISIPFELTDSDKLKLEEWRMLAENMLYRIALFLDGRLLDTSVVPWMAAMLARDGRKVFYACACIDSDEYISHWFVLQDKSVKRRVVWAMIRGQNVLTIVPHESDFEFIGVLKGVMGYE